MKRQEMRIGWDFSMSNQIRRIWSSKFVGSNNIVLDFMSQRELLKQEIRNAVAVALSYALQC